MMALTRQPAASRYTRRTPHCRPASKPFGPAADAVPIWLAALIASRCQATRAGSGSAVSWKNAFGKASYTNSGTDTELIQPLGVALRGGQTLVVSWTPGGTTYTLEVY